MCVTTLLESGGLMQFFAPSKTSPWQGTPVEGSPYTRQQLDTLKHERPTWISFHNRPVTLTAPTRKAWQKPEETVVMCPIIAWTKDRARVLVVTPGGDKKWVPAVKAPRPDAQKGRTP